MYRWTSKSFYSPLKTFFGMSLNFCKSIIPSPPFPQLGLPINIKVGCSDIYVSSAALSSGIRNDIGLKLKSFGKLLLMRLLILQNTFFLARYSLPG